MKSRIIKAMEYIKGYCEKHEKCDDCKLLDKEKDCCKIYNHVPCDWKVEKGEQEC